MQQYGVVCGVCVSVSVCVCVGKPSSATIRRLRVDQKDLLDYCNIFTGFPNYPFSTKLPPTLYS